jgi:hypothetical protein
MILTAEQVADIKSGKTTRLWVDGDRLLDAKAAKALAQELQPYSGKVTELAILCGASAEAYNILKSEFPFTNIVNVQLDKSTNVQPMPLAHVPPRTQPINVPPRLPGTRGRATSALDRTLRASGSAVGRASNRRPWAERAERSAANGGPALPGQ